jgi:hypothetical protein
MKVSFGSNLQLKQRLLFKVNLMTSRRKFKMLRKSGQGYKRSWRSIRRLQSRIARRWMRQICSSRSSCPSKEMLLHQHEQSCYSAQFCFELDVHFRYSVLWRFQKDDVSCNIIDDVTAPSAAMSLMTSLPIDGEFPST